LKRVRSGDGVDVTDTGFDVPVSANVDRLVVELTSHLSEISGTVDRRRRRQRSRLRRRGLRTGSRPVEDGTPVRRRGPPRRGPRVPRAAFPRRLLRRGVRAGRSAVSLNDPEILQAAPRPRDQVSIDDAEKKTLALTLGEPPCLLI
jgi:hypothetical protein